MQSISRHIQVWLTSSLGFVHTASSSFACPGLIAHSQPAQEVRHHPTYQSDLPAVLLV